MLARLSPIPLGATEEALEAQGALGPDRPEPIVNKLAKFTSSSRTALRGSILGRAAAASP
jgi:hypothetical protein